MFGSLWNQFTGRKIYPTIEKYIARSYPLYVAISEYTKRKIMEYGVSEDKIIVNHLAVDHEMFYPAEPKFKVKNKLLISVGVVE